MQPAHCSQLACWVCQQASRQADAMGCIHACLAAMRCAYQGAAPASRHLSCCLRLCAQQAVRLLPQLQPELPLECHTMPHLLKQAGEMLV